MCVCFTFLVFQPLIILCLYSLLPTSCLVEIWSVYHTADDYILSTFEQKQELQKMKTQAAKATAYQCCNLEHFLCGITQTVLYLHMHKHTQKSFPITQTSSSCTVVFCVFQRWGSVIRALVDMVQHVRRLLEVSVASVHRNGAAGPANWVGWNRHVLI